MSLKEIVDISNALLTPLIAIAVAFIAWQQYQLQHKSFNAQMYERRFLVFKSFMSFFSLMMRDGKVTYAQLAQFYAETSEADFLFSDAVTKKREELYDRGIDMAAGYERMYPCNGEPGVSVGVERSKLAQENADHLKWFIAQIKITKLLLKNEIKT